MVDTPKMAASAVRILLVDDDEAFVAALTALLEASGFEVVGSANNGADAAAGAERTRPQVVTMDLDMPISDGVAAIQPIVALRIPVVVVTGSDSRTELMKPAAGA